MTVELSACVDRFYLSNIDQSDGHGTCMPCTAPDYTDRWTCDASGNVTVQEYDTEGTQPNDDNTNCIVSERYCLDQNGEVTFVQHQIILIVGRVI